VINFSLSLSESRGFVLAHSAMIEMLLALPLRTLQPYALICQYMATAHPMSVASVRHRSAADCLIRSAVDISHPRQQGNLCAGSSVTSDPVRGVIINGLGACAVGGVGKRSLFPGRATDTVPSSVVSTSTESLCHRVAVSTCQRKAFFFNLEVFIKE